MATRILRDDPHTSRFKMNGPRRARGKGDRFGPARDKNFLAYVRVRACCVCGAPGPSHAHHHGPRGAGQKTDDFRTVPLCDRCHRAWHQHGCFEPFGYHTRELATEHVLATQVSLLVTWLRDMERAA